MVSRVRQHKSLYSKSKNHETKNKEWAEESKKNQKYI